MCKVVMDVATGKLPQMSAAPVSQPLEPAGSSPDVVLVVGSAHLPGALAHRGSCVSGFFNSGLGHLKIQGGLRGRRCRVSSTGHVACVNSRLAQSHERTVNVNCEAPPSQPHTRPGLKALWRDDNWKELLGSATTLSESSLLHAPPLDSVPEAEIGRRRGLLQALLRLSVTQEVGE